MPVRALGVEGRANATNMTLSLSTGVLELRIPLKVLSYELLRRLYPGRVIISRTFAEIREQGEYTMSNTVSETVTPSLAELSRKTGLILRTVDITTVNNLFAELEKYDSQERAKTFNHLKDALNETRVSLGAEAVYLDE
jgi:hypothetical protein